MPSHVTYPLGQNHPEPGEAREVAPGVLWVRMPMDLTGLDHINLWLLRDGEGWTIVDTGLGNEATRDNWENVFSRYLDGRPVTRVICTHHHIDHMGQAGWLTQRWGCRLWMTRGEWLSGRMYYCDAQDEVPDFFVDHFRRVGFNNAAIEEIRSHGYRYYADGASEVPQQYRRIRDGEVLSVDGHGWRVIAGYGHTTEHAALYCEALKVLISGDQILPRITPHIGVYPAEPDGNPLQEYLDSLEAFRPLPADVFGLPAHGWPFTGLHDRLDYLRQHHVDRLTVLEELAAQPTRAMSTLRVLYRRRLRDHETHLGIGEALAHLNCLIAQGRMVREVDGDGIWVYRRSDREADAA